MALTVDEAFNRAREVGVAQHVEFEGWRGSFAHTCKHKGRPAGKYGRAGVGYGWPAWLGKFSEKENEILRDVVSRLSFDYSLPRSLYPDFRGFWPFWVAPDLLKDRATTQVQADEFMMLFAASDQVERAIQELIKNPEFMGPQMKRLKKVVEGQERQWREADQLPKGVLTKAGLSEFFWQRDSRRYVAQHMVQVFFEGVGECQHFARQTCVICEEKFQPEKSEGVAEMMAPIICEACASVLRVRLHGGFYDQRGLSNEEAMEVASAAALGTHDFLGFIPKTLTEIASILRNRYSEGADFEELGELWKRLSVLWASQPATLFGGWPHFMHHLGLFVEERSGQGGYRSFGDCGHLCLSSAERSICDVLHKLGIPHEKEVFYPKHPDLNPNKKLRCDYVFDGRWIEFAGRMDDDAYAERMGDKRRILALNGIQLEIVLPRTLVQFLEELRT